MKLIPVTRGLFTTVDDADFDWLSQYKWYAIKSGPGACYYARRWWGTGSREKFGPRKSKTISMHRMILNIASGKFTDHINHNTLDNRRENLRECTNSQNQGNKKKVRIIKGKPTTSRFKGVSRSKRRGKYRYWNAAINYTEAGKTNCRFLGSYRLETEAAQAYDKAALKYHKEFANLNYPEECRQQIKEQ